MVQSPQKAVEGGHIFGRLSPRRHHGRVLHPSGYRCGDLRSGLVDQSEDFLEISLDLVAPDHRAMVGF